MIERTKYDAIVVGSGATGGWIAMELTTRGFSVLLLEAGDHPDSTPRPKNMNNQLIQSQNLNFREHESHLYVDDIDHPYVTPVDRPFNWIRARVAGGRTNVWGRVMLRMAPIDFRAASHDGFGVDWPVSYNDLCPYYSKVERFFSVSVENFLREHKRFKSHLIEHSNTFQSLAEAIAADTLGAELQSLPRVRKDTIGGILKGEKPELFHTSLGSTISTAMTTGRLTFKLNTIVRSIECLRKDARLAGSVQTIGSINGEENEYIGRVVVICASTIESTRILLNSATTGSPDGLANSSGLLGLYLTDHFGGVKIEARKDSKDEMEKNHSTIEGLHIPRFRNLTGNKSSFLRGYGFQGGLRCIPGETKVRISVMGEVLSRETNVVTIDKHKKDKWGIPAAKIDFAYTENEEVMAADAAFVIRSILDKSGYETMHAQSDILIPGTRSHELGTARMGDDAKSSVLNPLNRTWDLNNLFVVDGSCFPSSGSQNPTLTMLALAARASEFMSGELQAGRL